MRTDLEIKRDVKDELGWEPRVSSDEIEVEVHNGNITLSGVLDTYSKKVAAEKAALRVGRVAGVTNNIVVKLTKRFERSDEDIEKAVRNALKWSSSVPEENITVGVKDGWITLEGDIEWEYLKQAAQRVVEDLTGVKGVNNLLRIESKTLTSSQVKDKIQAALKRNINIHDEKINVSVSGDKITLTGKVLSFSEKTGAGRTAWSAPGISEVVNKLEVTPMEVRTGAAIS